jgi:hypothetical protein
MMSAISLAESSGESGVVSPAGAIGLWQVMPFWAEDFGWPLSYLYQPLYSARAAKMISGDGTNVGAWDTCYYPTSSAADRKDLSWPEQHSDAWNILQTHGVTTGGSGGGGLLGSPSPGDAKLAQQVAWANHLQENAIPNNTAWVAYNRKLHYTGSTAL